MLTSAQALDTANQILSASRDESKRLDRVKSYLEGTYSTQAFAPPKAREDYKALLARSRVPVLSLVVDSLAQNLFVDGYRPANSADNAASWESWQANRMDARQDGLHRAAIAYGASYLVILPGNPVPAWRPVSARRMSAVYSDRLNDEWPVFGLESWTEGTPSGAVQRLRLYDDQAVYTMTQSNMRAAVDDGFTVAEHRAGVCPVVRYVTTNDLDLGVCGEVEPLIALQDQLDAATYYIEMAQQYAVHRQRFVTGMAIEEDDDGNPKNPFDIAMNSMLQAEEPDTKFGEFEQSDIKSWLDAREATLRHIAIKSQVSPVDILGEIVNISAEALAAAESGKQRKVGGFKSSLGESHEQAFRLDALYRGDVAGATDLSAQVAWRDTESRSLSQTADALGKLSTMLGVPPRGLWRLIPGVTDQTIAEWEALADQADAFGRLEAQIAGQFAAEQPAA